uniref:Methyltransferase domain-containing protein n=1 Tax=Chromera velia CCMP2878 TaxID=1169474 RepID=A0A0G4HHH9_9ALVE|eukprot:Cvel_6885.t1-p1 / transcript=Cvel_6885.t1 / gene=Cvel_6885 / organism=Chromera_velia_CCMP2878 / gene_product=UPF0585 protein C16orf13 homolog A, putative / transcript_product=UPF0585 protein C16orf13 homolog A, putative / location=Cvel_scaffold348:37450-40697(-) / protein_length=261 / sequence_SO=supercontig / SO=protein_coding / is_pseudo=false
MRCVSFGVRFLHLILTCCLLASQIDSRLQKDSFGFLGRLLRKLSLFPPMESQKRIAGAAERNKEPIAETLKQFLPTEGRVLEVASGTGQHVAHLATCFPGLQFLPSEFDREDLPDSIRAHSLGMSNVLPPVFLDSSSSPSVWKETVGEVPFDAVIVANMCHISPWKCTAGLVCGAAAVLRAPEASGRGGGLLCIYGPFLRNGKATTESNARFDSSLRESNPEWGYRDLEGEMGELLEANGFKIIQVVDMPANNFYIIAKKS